MAAAIVTSANFALKQLYAVTLDILRVKIIDSIEEGDVALDRLQSQLRNEFEAIKAKLTRILDVPLKSALSHMQEAVIYADHGNLDQAKRSYDLCHVEATRAFSSSESFPDRCMATRLTIMCTLYLNNYFHGDCNIVMIQELCKNALSKLFAEPEVRSAIRDEFESIWFSYVSRKTRFGVFGEISDLVKSVGDHTGRYHRELTTSSGSVVEIHSVNPMKLTGHSDSVNSLVVAGGRLYSGSDDKSIKVWDVSSYACVATLTGHSKSVTSLVVAGGRLYSGSDDKSIKVWDVSSHACVATLTDHSYSVTSLVVAGGRLYSGSRDNSIKVWDVSSYACVATLTGHSKSVTSLVVAGGRLYSGSDDKSIKVWDVSSHACVATLTGHSGDVRSLVVAGGRLYSGSWDNSIKVWDVSSHACVATLTGHSLWVTSLVVAGGRLYSGSADGSIKVWDVSSYACVATLTGHSNWVESLVVGGGRLYSVSADKSIKVWLL